MRSPLRRRAHATLALLLRGVARIPLGERWLGSVRLDVPVVLTNVPAAGENGDGFVFRLRLFFD